mmetsp:Transcript_58409/g.136524  ORF Transcript_58409/g.136524 Transcript_58409/m.136524 type:complete len:410 (-) Transcript_58409:126-1355(-)
MDSAKRPSRLKGFLVDSAAMQGRREKQEDRHVKIADLTKAAKALKMPIDHLEQPCAFFGVYDGHQGHLCSEFVAKNFHLKFLQKVSAIKDAAHWTEKNLSSTLQEVSEELDADFLAKFRTAPDGCTLVVAVVLGTRLFVAWAGDSRCLLCRHTSKGEIATVALSEDHRPSMPGEAERVQQAGGVVVNFDGALRVAHQGFEERMREIRRAKAQGLGTIGKEPVALAVTRALGDRHFKAVTGKALLSAKPSIQCVRLDESCQFVALMCDGIPDVMRNEEIVFELDFSRDADAAADVKAACGALVQTAYKRGSSDNLTVILARLQWTSEGVKEVKPEKLVAKAVDVPPASGDATQKSDTQRQSTISKTEGESAVAALKRQFKESTAERAAKAIRTGTETGSLLLEPLDDSAL